MIVFEVEEVEEAVEEVVEDAELVPPLRENVDETDDDPVPTPECVLIGVSVVE